MKINWKHIAVFLIIGVGSFMGAVDSAISSIIVPVVQKDFSTSVTAVQWVSLAYLVAVSGFLPIFGRLGDLWGHNWVYLLGIFSFTLSSLLCGLAPTVGLLIGFRIFQAIGSAMLIAVAPAILIMNFPTENLGRVLGLQLILTYLGLIAGPSLGGFITYYWSWRAAFWINVPIGIVLFFSTLWLVSPSTGGRKERFDLLGAFLLFTAVISLLLGITDVGIRNAFLRPVLIILGIASGVFFARHELGLENRQEPVLLRMSLFRNRSFSLSAVVCIVGYTCEFFISFLLPFYITQVLGLSISTAGLLLTVKSFVMVFAAPFAGHLSDRLGPRPLSIASMTCYMLSLFLQAQLTRASGITWLAMLMILSGLAAGFFVSPNNSAMLGGAPPSSRGVVSSILGLVRHLGMSLGVALSGMLLSFRMTSLLDGFRFAMTWGAVIAAAGIAVAVFQQPTTIAAEERQR